MRERLCVALAVIRFQRCRPSTSGTVLMGTNWKEDTPVKMACRVIKVMLTGCNSVFKGIDASRALTAITTQSNILEGSRLQKCGYISTSILACTSTLSRQSNSNWSEPQVLKWPSTVSFIGKTHDVIPEPVMSWLCHGITSLVFHATSHNDVVAY